MFNRKESLEKAIQDGSIDKNTLELIIDFHILKGTLSEEDGNVLFGLLNPAIESEEEIAVEEIEG